MIIIEGSDLVGKSILAWKLARHLDWSYQHLGRLPEGFDRLNGHLQLASPRLVQDRFHMSDIVYRRALCEEQKMTPEIYQAIDNQINAFTVVVVCNSDELLAERYAKRAELYPLDRVLKANDLYSSLVCGLAFKEFAPKFDGVIATDETHPFPDSEDISKLLEDYCDKIRTKA
jgi:thymidylate kinase